MKSFYRFYGNLRHLVFNNSWLCHQADFKDKKNGVNYILAFIIAGLSTFSLFKSDGNHWTQILAIALFAPVSILGGMLSKNRYD